jgi:hypothetical protein
MSNDLPPWLRGMSDEQLKELAIALTTAICRPSFGSLSKRELEQTTFQLLYERRRRDWRTLGDIADDLAITRTKANALKREFSVRQAARVGRGERQRLLKEEVLSWPEHHVGHDDGQLRIVVDDPFIRDLLKDLAYGRRILLDQSFSAEVLTFGWDAYGQLLSALYEQQGGVSDEDVGSMAAEMRRQVRDAAAVSRVQRKILDQQLAKLDAELDKVLRAPAERRAALVRSLAKTYGPTVVGLLLGTIGI